MEIDARGILLGAGLFGMIVGAALGLAAGANARDCDAAFAATGISVCEGYHDLRIAAFGLVGLAGLVSIVPLASFLRQRTAVHIVWRR